RVCRIFVSSRFGGPPCIMWWLSSNSRCRSVPTPMSPKKKPQQTLADYVTIALSPALIMALVGSLIFFLLEVLYVGQYSGRMQWTLFFFVFGIVLVARIA